MGLSLAIFLGIKPDTKFTLCILNQDLLAKVDPEKFKALFGTDVTQAQSLIETKALTISKLVRNTIISRLGNRRVRVSVFGSKNCIFLAVCGQI